MSNSDVALKVTKIYTFLFKFGFLNSKVNFKRNSKKIIIRKISKTSPIPILTPIHCKGCIKVVCRFFRGILNRFLGKFQSEYCYLGKNFFNFFRLFDSGFNLFQINESVFSEKRPLYNLYSIQVSKSICEKFEKKCSKICHRMRHKSYKMRIN